MAVLFCFQWQIFSYFHHSVLYFSLAQLLRSVIFLLSSWTWTKGFLAILYDPAHCCIWLSRLVSFISYSKFIVWSLSSKSIVLFECMKWSFSLAIELSYCSKHTKSTIFLSYQAFLAYNPKEFLGVITNWHRCRGEEIED